MTVQEMHNEFKITLDKVDSQAYPEFLDGEVDFYLNEAQDRFIKTRYGRNNLYRSGFEELQKRTDDLKALVVSRFCQMTSVPYYGSTGDVVFRADLESLFEDEGLNTASTDEYMLYIKASAYTCIDKYKVVDGEQVQCCDWHRVKLVQQDDLSSVAGDPFNKPMPERPVIFFEDGDIFVWTGTDATIGNFLVTFIRRPLNVDLGTYGGTAQDCELSEYTHKEIVQMAVRIALENIESPRQQTQEALNVRNVE
jgi:hypothetical protein